MTAAFPLGPFTDTDDFEGATIDPVWDPIHAEYGTVTLSTDQAYSGSQSLRMESTSGGNRNMVAFYYLEDLAKGTVSVQFYDPDTGPTLYAYLEAWNTLEPGAPGSRMAIGVRDADGSWYYAGDNNVQIYPVVARTEGWHQFTVVYHATEVEYLIDGVSVLTQPGDYAFDRVTMTVSGPSWRPNETFYWDAFVLDADPLDGEAPVISDVVASPNPVAVTEPVTLSATVDDSLTGNSPIAAAEYSIDGGPYSPMTATDGALDAPTEAVEAILDTFESPDVHELCVRGADAVGNISSEQCLFLAVYDPTAGFVTGGGWIWSNPGDYVPDPSLEGKATFGFVSKYKKGATVPTGNTEFQFNTADLNFHSDSYEWLVVTGSDYAKFKGVGTINGEGEYKFKIWAGDDDPDTFRIKIWTEDSSGVETVVYDNGMDQAIGGGNIVIHTKK